MANASPSRTFLNELASQLAAVPSAPIDIDIDINQLANMLREGPKIERADGSQSGRLSELLANVISPQQAFYLQPYYLNNRRRFVSFVNELFAQLKGQDLDLSKEEVQDVCSANNDSDEFSLKLHQKIVERYMNKTTPYRGLLLFHGLGSGKTCSSIAIAEAMKTTKPILVILPATLKDNYRKQIKFCGSAQYRTTVRWQPRNVTELSDAEKQALGTEGVPQVWSASAAGQPFEALTQDEQRAVVAQIDKLIDQKFTFISLDSPVLNDTLAKLKTLDNHVVILDEVQRLLTMITNKIDLARRLKNEAVLTKSAPGMLYNMLTTAKNSRIVFLSGTPMTNTADEIGVMYNMLRGNITVWEWKATDVTQLQDQLRNNPFYLAEKYKLIDVVQVDNNSIRVTRNPFGFVNKFATSNDNTIVVFEGVEYSELGEGQVNDADFVSEVTRILKAEASGVTGPGEKPLQFKAFPDNPDDFYAKYVENDTEVKNSQLFQTRILGLTSFFKPQDTTEQQQMLPQLDMQVCYCPASKIQTLVYDDLRRERRGKGEGSLSDDDYMFYERSVSNFVLPVELQKERKASDDTTKVALLSSFNKLITFLFENYGSTLLSLNKVKKDDVVNNTLFQSIKQELETNLTQFVKPFAKLEEMITTEFKTYEKPLTVFLQYKSDKEYALTKELKKSVVLNKVLAMQHNLFYFDSQAVKLIETPIERKSHLTGFAASVQEMDVSVDYTSASSSDLYTFSPKMLIMAQHILRAPKFKHLVYSDKLVFDGVDYMGYVLEEQGYEEFTIAKLLRKTDKPLDLRKRYFIKYTGEQSIEDRNALLAIYNLRSARDVATLQSTAERPIRNYVEVFLKDRAKALGKNLNERYNIFGDIIHVFMTTSAGSTGLDLKNTRYVHIMEPYWQFVRMEQTIGRARRICSHVDLPKKEWRVQVYFYLTIFNKAEKQFDKSIDWKMLYNVAARKKDLSDNFLRIMQSSAIDCKLHAHDNKLCFDYGSKENMNPAIESYVPDGNQPYVTEPAFVQGALLRQRNAQGQEIRVYDLSRYVSAASYADWQNGKTRPMTQEDVRYVASQLPKLRQTEAGTVRQLPAPERQRVEEDVEEEEEEEEEVYAKASATDQEETEEQHLLYDKMVLLLDHRVTPVASLTPALAATPLIQLRTERLEDQVRKAKEMFIQLGNDKMQYVLRTNSPAKFFKCIQKQLFELNANIPLDSPVAQKLLALKDEDEREDFDTPYLVRQREAVWFNVWSEHLKYVINPFELLQPSGNYARWLDNRFLQIPPKTLRPISRAYFKMYEMLADPMFDLLKNITTPSPLIVCLAESPGGFIEALLDFDKTPSGTIIAGISLAPNNIKTSAWADLKKTLRADQLLQDPDYRDASLTQVYLYEGDLTVAGQRYIFESKFGTEKAMLITSDGGRETANVDTTLEQDALHLIMAEVYMALKMQAVSGNFVLKIYEITLALTINLLEILQTCYEHVYIHKPFTSRPTSPEKYVVCINFQPPAELDTLLEQMAAVIDEASNWIPQKEQITQLFEPDTRLVKLLDKYVAMFTAHQSNKMKQAVDYLQEVDNVDTKEQYELSFKKFVENQLDDVLAEVEQLPEFKPAIMKDGQYRIPQKLPTAVASSSADSSSGTSSDPIVIDESVDKSAPASPAALDIPVPTYPGPPMVRAETPFAPELFLLQRVPASVRAIVKNMIDNVDVTAPSFHAEMTLPYGSYLLPSSILNEKYWSIPDRAVLRVHVIAPNIATLKPNTCTENEILNGTLAYMKILHARKDVLILDSAFYSTLRPSSAQGTLNLEANSVARAARYIDVSQYRLILVPVHGAAHWSLGAIWPQMNEVTYYDSLGSAAKHSTVCDDLRLWYQDRMRKQNQSGNFVLTPRPVPRALIRQDNLDCGLYMLFFAEMLMLQQEARLETPQPGDSAWVSQHMPLVRELIAYLFMQYRVDQEMVWNKPASPSASAPRSRKRVASPGEQTATSMKKSKKQGGTRKISRH